jgi:hypothetical protein
MLPPSAFKGLRNSPIKQRKPVPMEIGATLKRQGLSQDDYDLDQMVWNEGAMPRASNGIFATDEQEAPGALGGMASIMAKQAPGMSANLTKAPAPAPEKKGPGLLDYLGLAGATMQEMGGITGAVNDFTGRRQAAAQEGEMNSLLEGLDLSPEELGMVKAGQGLQVLSDRNAGNREEKIYKRGRADTVADQTRMRGYQTEDREDDQTFQRYMQDDDQTFRGGQFDRTMEQGDRQHKDTIGLGYANLKSDEAIARDQLAKKGNGGWTPAGLLNAYTRANTSVDELEKTLGDMEQVAAESEAFQKTAKDFGSIGPGIDKAVGRFFSGLTGGDANTLDRNTKSISALMKKPGGGAWTDADQKVAESYAVNAANTPEANNYAAAIASNRARRMRGYVDFLRENIDDQDPTSLQQAKQIWSEYARENPMFQPDGTVNDTAAQPSIDAWMQSKMQMEQQGVDTSGSGPVRVTSEADVANLPPGTQFITPEGEVYTKR